LKSCLLSCARSRMVDYLIALFFRVRLCLWTVPTRQVPAFIALLRVQRAAHRARARHYLDAGTLLGAVRQGAFAGRPSDIDVTFPHCSDAALVVQDLLSAPRFEMRKTFDSRFHLYFRLVSSWGGRIGNPILVDITCGQYCMCSETEMISIARPCPDITAQLFTESFPICRCYERRLKSLYGPEWKTPNSPQFAMRKPNIQVTEK